PDSISVPFDQEHLAWVCRNGSVDAVGDYRQALNLVGGDFPRAGVKRHRIEVDSRHTLAQRQTVADLVERIGPIYVVHRPGPQRVIDVVGLRIFVLNDVALPRDTDHRRRQIDEIAKWVRWSAIAIVDDNDLAPVRHAAVTVQKTPVLVVHRVDPRAIRPIEYRYRIRATSLDVHVLCLPPEPIRLIVAYDRRPTLLDDHAARLLNQESVALAHLATGPAHIIKTPRIILSRRWHEGALHLRCLRSGRRRRQLNRGRCDGGLSDRLLWCNRTWRVGWPAPPTRLGFLGRCGRGGLHTLLGGGAAPW